MPRVHRSSDVVEGHSEIAISFGVGAVACFFITFLLIRYRGSTGMFVPLAIIILLIGLLCLGYGAYCAWQIRGVKHVTRECPFCKATNALDGDPEGDFLCLECHRLIPV